jgi:hypothetical protein
MREPKKRLFSKHEMAIVAAVAACIIGVGIVSAFPNGLHLSPSYEVRYTGTDTTVLLGDIDIDGDITGTLGLHNVTRMNIPMAGSVTIDPAGSPAETFTDISVAIHGGDGAIQGTVKIPVTLTPGAALYNGSLDDTWMFAAESTMLDLSTGATVTMHDASISVDNGSWTTTGAVSLSMNEPASATVITDHCTVSSDNVVELSVEKHADFNNTLLDVLGEELPSLPVSLGGVAAVLPGNATAITVDEGTKTCDNVSLFRGSWTASFGDTVSLQGDALLVLIDTSLYSPADAAIWFIPDQLLGLWPLAIGIWLVAALLQRRSHRDRPEYDRELYWLAVIIHLLILAVTFFLWDAEIRYLFGTSLLDGAASAVTTGGASLASLAIMPLELVPWFLGLAFIALPVRVILAAVFRLVDFDTLGDGIAKGIGLLALLFIGSRYIPFFLNVTVLALLQDLLGL